MLYDGILGPKNQNKKTQHGAREGAFSELTQNNNDNDYNNNTNNNNNNDN